MKTITHQKDRRFFITVLMGFFIITSAGIAYAGIAVNPERHVIELSQGEEAYVEYQIYNSGKEQIDISIVPEDLGKIQQNQGIDINSWVKPEENEILVKPGETEKMGIHINVPEDAVGELNSMIELNYQEDKNSVINIKYGAPLYVLIKGTENIDAQINSVQVKSFQSPVKPKTNKLKIIVKVKNTGNRHFWPKIWAIIIDDKGSPIKKLVLSKPWPVFSGQVYGYIIKWDNYNLAQGDYICRAYVQYDENEIINYDTKFYVNENKMVQKKEEQDEEQGKSDIFFE